MPKRYMFDLAAANMNTQDALLRCFDIFVIEIEK